MLTCTSLPTGQLAEAIVTKFDSLGRPIGGTILIDDDANGIGWYIDPTPLDNSEFTSYNSQFSAKATTNSVAYGKYDLFTTVLHEMGHIAGFITGHEAFDSHIQTINGRKVFVGDDFTAILTPDGSHLDSKLYPLDLMNTTLTPGDRKLPSDLNVSILKAIRGGIGDKETRGQGDIVPTASLTSSPLIAILNDDFDLTNPDHPDFGWNRRGAANILNGQAILTEDSPLLSNFTQTFIVPDGAKTLQFTLIDPQLGKGDNAPPDALEVALLDFFGC
jgi:hypothetical protein